jgi:hypothetical protein
MSRRLARIGWRLLILCKASQEKESPWYVFVSFIAARRKPLLVFPVLRVAAFDFCTTEFAGVG